MFILSSSVKGVFLKTAYKKLVISMSTSLLGFFEKGNVKFYYKEPRQNFNLQSKLYFAANYRANAYPMLSQLVGAWHVVQICFIFETIDPEFSS